MQIDEMVRNGTQHIRYTWYYLAKIWQSSRRFSFPGVAQWEYNVSL